ncbi:Protein-S-isoprenylcysteine O-methyltransferase Ste14 [Chitinophaga eiseniae]|uniref:Protein-S-isoprenylcysteine O-methyltransferase Ste14 n=1 Tax=Chitinophaga eiseniae TaxID=634771 RepID=A0A1T4T9M5_9BACT|nr:isoprenylcysteine carboxylmethyltransferase family protein [Chitinophaga eiseniae]SKA36979.1 Protein-S-isoprenylcysteine O-methyltransferase Ste14 [Chitinophaga eiseniae]
MSQYIKIGLKVLWLIVLTYWFISGLIAKKAEHQEPFIKRFVQYWLPLIIAMLFLGPGEWFGRSWLRENFIEHSDLVGTIGLSISVIGAIIACASRYKLGRNWSLSVQKKEDHQLIQDGIYRIVRHPIYTGLLLLFIGNALIVGDYRAIIAVLIVFVSLWLKLKKEEKLLIEIFGTKYTEYQNRTKAIIPYLL